MNKLLVLLVSILVIVGCSTDDVQKEQEPTPSIEVKQPGNMDVTHTGVITLNGMEMEFELYGNHAIDTVENFVKLSNEGFYDGLTMHRIIEGFMIQGGDPSGDGTGGAENNIKGEFANNGYDNTISHVRGVMSMARRGDSYDSATSQFFITHQDSSFLDGDYAAFGMITSGFETLDTIASVKTDVNDAPIEPVIIDSIVIN